MCAKLCVEGSESVFRDMVNGYLPSDIQVIDIVDVTKNFNAKNSCDRRTYEYLAPTFVFAPKEKDQTENAENKRMPSATGIEAGHFPEMEVNPNTWKRQKEYRLNDDTYQKLNETLSVFLGTHNFHNFTSKLEPHSPK